MMVIALDQPYPVSEIAAPSCHSITASAGKEDYLRPSEHIGLDCIETTELNIP